MEVQQHSQAKTWKRKLFKENYNACNISGRNSFRGFSPTPFLPFSSERLILFECVRLWKRASSRVVHKIFRIPANLCWKHVVLSRRWEGWMRKYLFVYDICNERKLCGSFPKASSGEVWFIHFISWKHVGKSSVELRALDLKNVMWRKKPFRNWKSLFS